MNDHERPLLAVEELTLALLDRHEGEAEAGPGREADAEVEELEALLLEDGRAMEVHLALVELEAALRGCREGLDLAGAVVSRVRRELAERVERGVMEGIAGRAPAEREGGESMEVSKGMRMDAPTDAQPVAQRRRLLAGRGLWLASAAAGIVIAAAVGLVAVPALRVGPGGAPPGDDAALGEEPVAGDAVAPKPDADGLVPIPLKLPKPAFIGTPKQIPEGTTVQKGDDKARPDFLAPPGVENVALGKPVAASDEEPVIGETEQVTDGDKEVGDGSYVEFGLGTQHVTIDLEETYELHAILVWHYHGDPRIYRDVIVQVADDPDFITGVKTLFNNDHDNSSGYGLGKEYEYFETYEGLLVGAKGMKTRYVRLYSNGSTVDDVNRYTEVEVYGIPVQ